jgi:hypothetical protein
LTDLLKNTLNRASQKTLLGENPDLPEKAILYALAKKGPMTLAELEKTTSSFGNWEANHYTIKRRFKGLKNHLSLIDYEYVKERKPDIRKPGKYGKVYCLTTKGFLASLAVGIPIDKIDIFKKYTKFLSYLLDRKIKYIGTDAGYDSTLNNKEKQKILHLFTSHIKLQIAVFLIWHEANETSIRKKRDSGWHIENFFNSHDEFIYQEFPMLLEDKIKLEYREILRDYFATSKILQGIMESTSNKNKKIRDNVNMLISFVYDWHKYFDELQMNNPIGEPYDVKKMPAMILSRPEYGIDIEFEGEAGKKTKIHPDIRNKASKELEDIIGEEIQINKIWNTRLDKKQLSDILA